MYGYQGTVGERINWNIGIDIFTLLYTKQTTNKDLLYTAGNSTQYSVMTYMGKESKWIHIKKAEHQRIDFSELWCWRRFLRVPWTARRSSQSILKEIIPEYSF